MIELKSTRMEYSVRDEGGYEYTVVATYDPECGWSSSVAMSSFGHVDSQESIKHLANAARAFLRALDNVESE